MRARPVLVLAGLAVSTTLVASSAVLPAAAAVRPTAALVPVTIIVHGLKGPVTFSVVHGKITIAQAGAGRLTRVKVDGTGPEALFTTSPKIVVGAVEAAGAGTSFTLTGRPARGKAYARLTRLTADGRTKTVASLSDYETGKNPDKKRTYGIVGLSRSCQKKLPKALGTGSYRGKARSLPAATALLPDGSVVVADTAANDLVRVTKKGAMSLVAVLPVQTVPITASVAAVLTLPTCTVGKTYRFEAAPTDVESVKGLLYVTTRPSGSLNPVLGARGKVYRINPGNHSVTQIGSGFVAPTGLAVDADGSGAVYVAEPAANRISTIVAGVRAPFMDLPVAAALEWSGGALYATTVPAGETTTSIVKINPGAVPKP